MKTLHAHLQLSTNLDGSTRDRCPNLVFTMDGEELAAVRTDTREFNLPLDAGSLDKLVLFDDALSRSIDEEAWLGEFARVIAPGGSLHLTVPAEGPLAWLDTMNAYRYIADISGRGNAPDAANPTGWNRHYTRSHIHRLMTGAGFAAPEIHGQNHALQESGLLLGLIMENWIRKDRNAELRLFPRFGQRDPRNRSGVLASTWSITAHKR